MLLLLYMLALYVYGILLPRELYECYGAEALRVALPATYQLGGETGNPLNLEKGGFWLLQITAITSSDFFYVKKARPFVPPRSML